MKEIRTTISPSQILCSLNFFWDKIMRFKREQDKNIYSAYGISIHHAIKMLIEKNGKRCPYHRYFQDRFELELKDLRMMEFSPLKKEEMVRSAMKILDLMVRDYLPKILRGSKVVELETRLGFFKLFNESFFESKVKNFNIKMLVDLVGYADLVLRRGKEYIVYDWKTGYSESYNRKKRRVKNPNPELFVQPVVYSFLISKKYKVPLDKIKFVFVALGEDEIAEEEILVRSTNKIFEELFKGLLKKVAKGEIEKDECKKCRYCPHKSRCEMISRYTNKDFEREISQLKEA